jgi:hypothetical protein
MVSLPMVMCHELVEHAPETPLAEENQTIKTLVANRPHEAFSVGVGVRRLDGRQGDAYSDCLEKPCTSPKVVRPASD